MRCHPAQIRRFAISKDTLHPLMRWNVPLSAGSHPPGVPNHLCHCCHRHAPRFCDPLCAGGGRCRRGQTMPPRGARRAQRHLVVVAAESEARRRVNGTEGCVSVSGYAAAPESHPALCWQGGYGQRACRSSLLFPPFTVSTCATAAYLEEPMILYVRKDLHRSEHLSLKSTLLIARAVRLRDQSRVRIRWGQVVTAHGEHQEIDAQVILSRIRVAYPLV